MSPIYVPWDEVSEGRRRAMKSNRSRDTGPELAVRRLLHRRGVRYRVAPLLRLPERHVRPDIVFGSATVAVFIDGCFWHGCPTHGTMPKTRSEYWATKFRANQERDRLVDSALETAGWKVVRRWEHEPPDRIADEVTAVVAARRR